MTKPEADEAQLEQLIADETRAVEAAEVRLAKRRQRLYRLMGSTKKSQDELVELAKIYPNLNFMLPPHRRR